jgi:hypothetical protein
MSKSLPEPSAQLNRLRAASALIPIIESGLAEGKLTVERATLMASFCNLALTAKPEDAEQVRLAEQIARGLEGLRVKFAMAE